MKSTENKKNENQKSSLEKYNPLEQQEENKLYVNEWQIIVKVLDRLLFILNVVLIVTAFGYGYITLSTH